MKGSLENIVVLAAFLNACYGDIVLPEDNTSEERDVNVYCSNDCITDCATTEQVGYASPEQEDAMETEGPTTEEANPADQCVPKRINSGFFMDPTAYAMQEMEVQFDRLDREDGMVRVSYTLTAPSACSDLHIEYIEFEVRDSEGIEWADNELGEMVTLSNSQTPGMVHVSRTYSHRINPEGTELFFAWASYDDSTTATQVDITVRGGETITLSFRWHTDNLPLLRAAPTLHLNAISYTDSETENEIWRNNPAGSPLTL